MVAAASECRATLEGVRHGQVKWCEMWLVLKGSGTALGQARKRHMDATRDTPPQPGTDGQNDVVRASACGYLAT